LRSIGRLETGQIGSCCRSFAAIAFGYGQGSDVGGRWNKVENGRKERGDAVLSGEFIASFKRDPCCQLAVE
jgi:hypothetical protein